MLGKLFKYEFRATGKLLAPLNLAVVILAFICNLLLAPGTYFIVPLSSLVTSFVTMIFTLTLFALFILTAVYLTVRFYRTMYGSQGYLTHTLPVSTVSILNVKILTAAFWLNAAIMIGAFSLFILGSSGLGADIEFQILISALNEPMKGADILIGEFLALMAVMLLAICFNLMLMVCASLAVGQLFRQFRIPAAIGAYVVFYIIQQIVSVIMLAALGLSQIGVLEESASQAQLAEYSGLYYQMFGLASLEAVVFGLIYYSICYFITKKQLNLE